MQSGSILLPNGTTTVSVSTPTLLTSLVNYAPVASFIAVMHNLVAMITDKSSDPNSGTALGDSWKYSWDFGDGTTAVSDTNTLGDSPTHTYGTAGSYTISLLLTDQYGLSSSLQTSVTASTPQVASGGGGGSISPTVAPVLSGDLNHDGKVDILDFNQLLVQWGMRGSNLAADLNHDGKVDILDFNQLLVTWSKK